MCQRWQKKIELGTTSSGVQGEVMGELSQHWWFWLLPHQQWWYGREKILKIENEHREYRREPFPDNDDKLKWLRRNTEKYPTVVSQSRRIKSIPPTQIDNEPLFSLTGRIANPLRSRLRTENIDNLISICRNYPDEDGWDSHIAATVNMSNFSDILVRNESTHSETSEDSTTE